MAETSEQIRRELARTRAQVGGTIAALERKVNPRHIIDEHPVVLVGAAFGAGVLLGATGSVSKAAGGVRAQLETGAQHASERATSAIDGLLHSVIQAASAAVTAKITEALSGTAGGGRGSRPQLTGSSRTGQSGSRAA